MRLAKPRIKKKLRRIHRRVIDGKMMSTAVINLRYTTGTADYNRNDAAAVLAAAAGADPASQQMNAGVHFITALEVAQRGMRVIAVGDVVVDFLFDADLEKDQDGKVREALEFEIQLEDANGLLQPGSVYVRKEGAVDELAEHYETVVEGGLAYQTVLLTRKQA